MTVGFSDDILQEPRVWLRGVRGWSMQCEWSHIKGLSRFKLTYLLGSKACNPKAEYLMVLSLASFFKRPATYSSDM